MAVAAELLLEVDAHAAPVLTVTGGEKGLEAVHARPPSAEILRHVAELKHVGPVIRVHILERIVVGGHVVGGGGAHHVKGGGGLPGKMETQGIIRERKHGIVAENAVGQVIVVGIGVRVVVHVIGGVQLSRHQQELAARAHPGQAQVAQVRIRPLEGTGGILEGA